MKTLVLGVLLALAIQSTAQGLNVSVKVELEGGDTPTVVGKTNLPDGTMLMVTVSRKASSYMGQTEATVSSGSFRAGPFSDNGGALNPGQYVVNVFTPLAALQPAAVRTIIGEDGGKLRGPCTKPVTDPVVGKSRVVDCSITVKVGGGKASASQDEASRREQKQKQHDWFVRACKDGCDLTASAAARRGERFDWDKCNVACLAGEKP